MKEDLLQYVWQFKLYDYSSLKTINGEKVEVIDVGRKNLDAGPDFFNAKVKIGSTLWAGNVEIHLNASDWYHHKHEEDPRYDSVMLHVVNTSDVRIYRKNGEEIPQLILKILPTVGSRYEEFCVSPQWIRCEKLWSQLPTDFWNFQINRFANERLFQKIEPVQISLVQNKNNWVETFYQQIARSFGMHANGLPFEMLAKSLPLCCIAKHKSKLFQVEALLFGQADLLSPDSTDTYETRLLTEYKFLKSKFDLRSIDASLWKFARMRPCNFPHIRIAQFASLLFKSNNLFSKILAASELQEIRSFLETEPSEYWKSHYRFGVKSLRINKSMQAESLDLLIINAIIPVLFAYSVQKEDVNLQEKLFSFLEQMPPEKNHVIEGWRKFGVVAQNAYQSQALLMLKKRYCDEKKCLCCSIGHKLMTKIME